MHSNRKNSKMELNGGNLLGVRKWTENLKIFSSRTRRPMILKLGMKHQAVELKVYINHDPGMTLTHFMARST